MYGATGREFRVMECTNAQETISATFEFSNRKHFGGPFALLYSSYFTGDSNPAYTALHVDWDVNFENYFWKTGPTI